MRTSCIALLITLALTVSSSADHWWGSYRWNRQPTFALDVGDNVSSSWDSYLDVAISDWNSGPQPKFTLVKVVGGASTKTCKPTAGRIEVCNSRYGNNGWLGIAQIWISGGQYITQAITKLNDTYFNTPTYNTPAWRRLVMCQEIAHDFGLDHQDEVFNNANLGSCMDYTNDPDGGVGGAVSDDPSNEHPNDHDYAQISIIYPVASTEGSDAPTSPMPPPMNNTDFSSPGEWGRLVRSNADGRVQVFERDFGRGNRVITHVFWVDRRGNGHEAHEEHEAH